MWVSDENSVTFELHYGGRIEWVPRIRYIGGWVDEIPNIDPDRMSILDLIEIHDEMYSAGVNKIDSAVVNLWGVKPASERAVQEWIPLRRVIYQMSTLHDRGVSFHNLCRGYGFSIEGSKSQR